MNSKNNINIELNEKYKIISNDIEFLQRVFGFPSDNLLSYSQIEYKGTTYKIGYFLTNFVEEVCLYEIMEIIIEKNNLTVRFVNY